MNYLKIILAVLLLLCLLDMPYGFYILIRYVATVVFGYMAYSYYQENKNELAIAAGALAVLFQPLVKFALGRFVWNVVDVVNAPIDECPICHCRHIKYYTRIIG